MSLSGASIASGCTLQYLQSIHSRLGQLDLDALYNETLFTLPTGKEQEDIDTQLESLPHAGLTPKVEFKSNFNTLLHAVSHGKGICFCAKLKKFRLDDDLGIAANLWSTLRRIRLGNGRLSREAKYFINMLPEVMTDF